MIKYEMASLYFSFGMVSVHITNGLIDRFCSFWTFNLVICKDSLLWQLVFPNDIGFSVDKTNRLTDLEAREIWEYALRFDLGVLSSVDLEALDCVQLFLRRHRGHLQRSPKLPHPAQLVGLDHTYIEKYLFIICKSIMYERSHSLADRHLLLVLLRHILVALSIQ